MMGIVNLKWGNAMAECGREFTAKEMQGGWPQLLTPNQIANLQHPWARGDLRGRDKFRWLAKVIATACDAGNLSSTIEERPFTVSDRMFIGYRQRAFSLGGTINTNEPEYRVVTKEISKPVTVITAPAFAAWLAAQGETPSPHVQAWFDAIGVAGQKAQTVNSTKGKKEDLVAPMIQKALQETSWNKAAAHALLIRWANEDVPPFIAGLDGGNIKLEGGETLKSEAIKARLKRAIDKKMTLADDN